MVRNLLIVFGGTEEGSAEGFNTQQSIFDSHDLRENSVDVLQLNLLTAKYSVTFRSEDRDINMKLTAHDDFEKYFQDKNGADIFDEGGLIQHTLGELKDALKKIGWSKITKWGFPPVYATNTSTRGLDHQSYQQLCELSENVICKFLSFHKRKYEKIYILAHSRGVNLGCKVAHDCWKSQSQSFQFNINRLVLLDPVSKNAGGLLRTDTDLKVINDGYEAVKDLSNAGTEIHIIVKTKDSGHDYESYAGELMGGGYNYYEEKIDEIQNRGSKASDIDMDKVYFHLAHMVHGYMLQGPNGKYKKKPYQGFHTGFKNYHKIISDNPWTEMYSNADLIDLDTLSTSQIVIDYLSHRELPNALKDLPQELQTDPVSKLYNTIEVDSNGNLRDRRYALIHALAYKTRFQDLLP